MQFAQLPAHGHALDLGCGTGTNAIYMAQQGWQVTGVDFVGQAVRQARRKAKQAGVAKETRFITGNVTRLEQYNLPPAQFALDMGCLHGLPTQSRPAYVRGLSAVLAPGAPFMLLAYQSGRHHNSEVGISIAEIERLFAVDFIIEDYEKADKPQLWYWLKRKNSTLHSVGHR